jgi:hypothetical protein
VLPTDLPPAALKSGHLLRDLPRRGKHERPGQLGRRIGRRTGMLARRHDHAAPRARIDVDVRIDTALTDESQLVEAFEQRGANLRSFADKDQNLSVSQALGERLDILRAIVPHGDLVARKLLKTGKGAQRIVIIVEYGNPHRGSIWRRSRRARPGGLTPTIQRPSRSSRVTSPRSLASSHTGSFGQDVRHASMTSS